MIKIFFFMNGDDGSKIIAREIISGKIETDLSPIAFA